MNLRMRAMGPEDITLGMRLKEQAGWNQTEADWRRFLDLEPDGCFVAEWDGRAVATTTTCVFESVGWIAMVLVDKAYRHRGIATRLVEHALEHLDGRGVATARLDATPLGRPVYERMGFLPEHDLVRLQGDASQRTPEAPVSPASMEDADSVCELDRQASATDRRRLITRLLAEQPDRVRLALRGETPLGYAMLRPGSRATQIGPAMAMTEQAGRALCDWAMQQCVFIDIPRQNHAAIAWARSRGLVEQRPFTRMYRGEAVGEQATLLWASSGPEKG